MVFCTLHGLYFLDNYLPQLTWSDIIIAVGHVRKHTAVCTDSSDVDRCLVIVTTHDETQMRLPRVHEILTVAIILHYKAGRAAGHRQTL